MRIGYDTQNGRGYVGIGKLLLDRGELQRGQASMQGILDYLRADPVRGAAVMNENPSWVFFRELTGPGPLGALGVPVTGRTSVAADPKYVPFGRSEEHTSELQSLMRISSAVFRFKK